MLDIRAVAYIAPLSEVDFAPVSLTVRIVNYADESGLVSAGFRIYNASTGLLVHQSDITPIELAKGQTADVSALTDFSPPAPADDTYFVVFDGVAANALVPDGISIHLGSFYFDVKPAPLGPIPAGHAVTHEDTGIDEIDVTGLSGLLADGQTPILHHLEHELGGADEVNLTGMGGELADDQPPKAHGNAAHTSTFEDQANKGAAGGYCGLPNPLDTTLPLRADGTPARPQSTIIELEMLQPTTFTVPHPWSAAAIASGTVTQASEKNHPGYLTITSAAAANSGWRFITGTTSILVADGYKHTSILRPLTLAGLLARTGFGDSNGTTDNVDGAYFEITTVGGVPGTLVGKTASNSVRSTTATSFVLTSGVWYRLVVLVGAASVTFFVYDDTNTLLWTDSLASNIPTAPGRETASVLVAANTIGGTVTILDIDYLCFETTKPLPR